MPRGPGPPVRVRRPGHHGVSRWRAGLIPTTDQGRRRGATTRTGSTTRSPLPGRGLGSGSPLGARGPSTASRDALLVGPNRGPASESRTEDVATNRSPRAASAERGGPEGGVGSAVEDGRHLLDRSPRRPGSHAPLREAEGRDDAHDTEDPRSARRTLRRCLRAPARRCASDRSDRPCTPWTPGSPASGRRCRNSAVRRRGRTG